LTACVLRPACPLDAGAVGAILSDFVDETAWMPRLHSRAEELAHAADLIDRGWVTVAERVGRVRGFLARDGASLHALYVCRAARGNGLGGRLLTAAQTSSARLVVWTPEANKDAHRFYERAGFALAERSDGSANDEGLPDRCYLWVRGKKSGRTFENSFEGIFHPTPEGVRQ
jgi:GNAT superfamily N-acetyltransferase